MKSDDLTNPKASLLADTETSTMTPEHGRDGASAADNHPEIERVASGRAVDGPGSVATDLTDDAGHATVAPAVASPGPRRSRLHEEKKARARDNLAAAKERTQRRHERDKAMLRKLVVRAKEIEAADRKRERREHEKQANAARYRFADSMLKGLAKLEQGQWPAEVREVIAKASAEDQAAINRIVERHRNEPLP